MQRCTVRGECGPWESAHQIPAGRRCDSERSLCVGLNGVGCRRPPLPLRWVGTKRQDPRPADRPPRLIPDCTGEACRMLSEDKLQLVTFVGAEVGWNIGDVGAIQQDTRWLPGASFGFRIVAPQDARTECVAQDEPALRRTFGLDPIQERRCVES